MLTEKYEFDRVAITTLAAEFVKRKFGGVFNTANFSVDRDGNFQKLVIVCNAAARAPGTIITNKEVLEGMAEGDRRIDIGTL